MAAGLTSHVLDTARGGPAPGMRLDLYSLDFQSKTRIVTAYTNQDGRTDSPLLSSAAMKPGYYQIDFHVGDYFEDSGIATTSPKFLDIVPVEFGIVDAAGHYHVPLLASPWSYSSYRGSNPLNSPDDSKTDDRSEADKENFRCRRYHPMKPNSMPAAPGTDRPGVTAHVLDLTRGCGAEEIIIDVFEIDQNSRHHLKSIATNNEGRSEEWLIKAGEIKSGQYEFAFRVGDYFSANGHTLPAIRYLDVIPVSVGLGPNQGHYHIPLLIAPWGFSTYRGS